jgi:hypothetical protein
MTTRCALAIDDGATLTEIDFQDIPRVGEHIQIDDRQQDIRVTRVLHRVDTTTGKAIIKIDATTAIL